MDGKRQRFNYIDEGLLCIYIPPRLGGEDGTFSGT
jgi:hypothetical protein